MSENTLEIPQSGFFDEFTNLLSNKHFWMVIFILTTIATAYYYYYTYINTKQDKINIEKPTNNNQFNNQQIQQLINQGILIPVDQQSQQSQQPQQPPLQQQLPTQQPQPQQQLPPQQPQQQLPQQPPQEQLPEFIEENTNVEEQNLTQEELNMIKQQLDQSN